MRPASWLAPHLDEHEGGVLQGTGGGALLALLELGRELLDDVAREAGSGHRGDEHVEGHLRRLLQGGARKDAAPHEKVVDRSTPQSEWIFLRIFFLRSPTHDVSDDIIR